MSRAAELISGTPLANLSIIALCCLIYAYQLLFEPVLINWTLCPRDVLFLHNYYRLITGSLFHGSLMHIGMNMSATFAVGSLLERRFGTLKYGLMTLWSIILTSVVYVLASVILFYVCGVEGFMYQHSVGFSGVLFHLSVMEANLSPDATRSVFGFCRVPAWGYPWALLVALQIVMPHISFMGHLSGILVGTLQTYGCLDFLFPSNEFLRELEGKESMNFLVGKPGFVGIPNDDVLRSLENRNHQGALVFVLTAFSMVFTLIKNVAETIKVIIFGNAGSHRGDWAEDDEDDWVVQPVIRSDGVEMRNV